MPAKVYLCLLALPRGPFAASIYSAVKLEGFSIPATKLFHFQGQLDVCAIALVEEQLKPQMMKKKGATLYRVEYNISPEAEEAFVTASVEQDAAFGEAGDPRTLQNAIRRSRKNARFALREQLRLAHQKKHTLEEYEERLRALEKSWSTLCGDCKQSKSGYGWRN